MIAKCNTCRLVYTGSLVDSFGSMGESVSACKQDFFCCVCGKKLSVRRLYLEGANSSKGSRIKSRGNRTKGRGNRTKNIPNSVKQIAPARFKCTSTSKEGRPCGPGEVVGSGGSVPRCQLCGRAALGEMVALRVGRGLIVACGACQEVVTVVRLVHWTVLGEGEKG